MKKWSEDEVAFWDGTGQISNDMPFFFRTEVFSPNCHHLLVDKDYHYFCILNAPVLGSFLQDFVQGAVMMVLKLFLPEIDVRIQ